MRVCNHTYVCFNCMESRRSSPKSIVYCPKCRNTMIELSYKIMIPKRRRKLWDEFKSWLERS